MGTIYEKLNYLDGTKGLIRDAINDKGGSLTAENTFRSYANAITQLPSGVDDIIIDFTSQTPLVTNNGLIVNVTGGTANTDSNGLTFPGENFAAVYTNISPFNLTNCDIELFVDLNQFPLDSDYQQLRYLLSTNNQNASYTGLGFNRYKRLCYVNHQGTITECPFIVALIPYSDYRRINGVFKFENRTAWTATGDSAIFKDTIQKCTFTGEVTYVQDNVERTFPASDVVLYENVVVKHESSETDVIYIGTGGRNLRTSNSEHYARFKKVIIHPIFKEA